MSSPINAVLTGTYTTAATLAAINLNIPSEYTKITVYNITDQGSTAANTNVMEAYATSSMPVGGGVVTQKTSGAATYGTRTTLAANGGGFTFVNDSGSSSLGAALAVTSATNATPIAVTMTSSTAGLSGGDVVRYTDAAGQLNVAGYDFTIDTVVANTSFNLSYSVAPGGAGTGGSVRRVPFDPRFYPPTRYIMSISKAASAVIVLSVTHLYTVGQQIRIIVPSAFGMIEMNNLLVTITAINTTTNSITVNVDSTNFTTFAFPTSAAAALGVSPAIVVPVGEAAVNSVSQPFGNLLDDATRNTSFNGVIVGTAVQTASKVYQWVAERGLSI